MLNGSKKSGGFSRLNLLRLAAGSAAGFALTGTTTAEKADAVSLPRVSGPLKSAGAMTFGPGNLLFVGDINGAAVHAFKLGVRDLTPQTDVNLGNFHNFEGRDLVTGVDQKLAAMLGTTYDKVVINDMVVHQPTQQIFLSVERGRGTDAIPAIIRVSHGTLELLDLDGLAHSQVAIPNEPDTQAMMEFDTQRSFAITDVKYYKGEIFVTGVSNQRFASTLHRIPYPFRDRALTSTMEIWHAVHGEFETRAPIIRQLIRELNGVPYLFAVYGCTPLVRFPLASLKDGAHVHGDVIGQLGYGSNPLDMVTFTDPYDHKEYLAVTIDVRGASRIAVNDLAVAKPGPTGGPIDFAPSGLGKSQVELPIKADHFDILNKKWGVIVARHPKSSYRLDISSLAAPYFFERKDGMAEMNWPNGPDPFKYREHRGEKSYGA